MIAAGVVSLQEQLRRSVDATPHDKRWLPVNDATPVIWEGELTTWGSLAGNERQMCEFNKDGVLEGGFPF